MPVLMPADTDHNNYETHFSSDGGSRASLCMLWPDGAFRVCRPDDRHRFSWTYISWGDSPVWNGTA